MLEKMTTGSRGSNHDYARKATENVPRIHDPTDQLCRTYFERSGIIIITVLLLSADCPLSPNQYALPFKAVSQVSL